MVEIEPSDPIEELQREHEVVRPLLERLVEVGERMKSGEDVPAGEIQGGLSLLDEYLHRVHATRIDQDLLPEARPVAMTTCFEHLDRIVHDHAASRERAERLRGLVAAYGKDPSGSRGELAEGLITLASEDHDLMTYEETYPFSCLVSVLPDEAASRVHGAFLKDGSGDLSDLEAHITRYLARPVGARETVSVKCSEPGCSRSGEAVLGATPTGRLALAPPPGGWTAEPAAPKANGPSRIRVDVAMRCPEHGPAPAEAAGVGLVATEPPRAAVPG